jgi:hypothetical protein
MTELVVDALEVIHVDDGYGQRSSGAAHQPVGEDSPRSRLGVSNDGATHDCGAGIRR